jgi:hypothetical protein
MKNESKEPAPPSAREVADARLRELSDAQRAKEAGAEMSAPVAPSPAGGEPFNPMDALFDVLSLLDELAKANTQAAPMGPAARTWSKTARVVRGHLERAGLRVPAPSGPNVLKTTSPYAKPAQRKLGG